LACDLVARNGWRSLSATNPQVTELSTLLRSLNLHPAEVRGETFRNPNGVGRKTADIATLHPDYVGRKTRGGSHDGNVLAQFIADPAHMRAKAAAIRDAAALGPPAAPADLDLDVSADEGGLLERRHLARERDPKLRARKIWAAHQAGQPIACEVCEFDFGATYGIRGEGYIEVHHRVPLHASGRTTTTLQDLIMLCSNCHRMIHRGTPWLTVEELIGCRNTAETLR
jgi:5-methylcytosine-specific restriction enzyme A